MAIPAIFSQLDSRNWINLSDECNSGGAGMSDGITMFCPHCGKFSAVKKEHDALRVKLKLFDLKHPKDETWFPSELPVYTCDKCCRQWAIERVNA